MTADEMRRHEEDEWLAGEFARGHVRRSNWRELAENIRAQEGLRRDQTPEWIVIVGIVLGVLMAAVIVL